MINSTFTWILEVGCCIILNIIQTACALRGHDLAVCERGKVCKFCTKLISPVVKPHVQAWPLDTSPPPSGDGGGYFATDSLMDLELVRKSRAATQAGLIPARRIDHLDMVICYKCKHYEVWHPHGPCEYYADGKHCECGAFISTWTRTRFIYDDGGGSEQGN